jgi:hypothetical protein
LEDFFLKPGGTARICVPAFFAGALFVCAAKTDEDFRKNAEKSVIMRLMMTKIAMKTPEKCHHNRDDDQNGEEKARKVSSSKLLLMK